MSNYSFNLGYLVGSVNGVVAYETVALGPYEISQQAIGEFHSHSTKARSFKDTSALVNETRGLNLSNAELSWRMFSLTSMTMTVRFFAFRLGRELLDSSLTFGHLDPSIANDSGSFAYTRSRVPGSPTPIAVLDPGTTFILGPSAEVAAFWETVGGAKKGDELWQIQRNRAVLVGFVLVATPVRLVNSSDWILGTTFLRNVYVTHHGATAASPTVIDLLNLINSSEALEHFQRERGQDPLAPKHGHAKITPRSP
ncbi:hypothetical protein BJY52DRAFT_1182872 [Lactarius psammicola]|nr:hypothetical protein BJY52DRAFT_1182872 [Lactarius psammicola]